MKLLLNRLNGSRAKLGESLKTKLTPLVLLALIVSSAEARAAGIEPGRTLRDVLPITEENNADVYATVPLPEGEWTVAFTNTMPTPDGKNVFRNVALYQTAEGKVTRAVYAHIKVDGPATRWADEPCKDSSVLYKNDYGTRLWQQKCLVIRTSTFLQSGNEVSRTMLERFGAKGIKTDFNSLSVKYTRYGDHDKFYAYELSVFPSAYGLENPVIGVLASSPWAAHNYIHDPEKVRFVDALKAYAETVVTELDRAYDTKRAIAPIRSFTYNRTNQDTRAANSESGRVSNSERPPEIDAPGSTIEKRLSSLKKLFEQGLLSKDEYDEKRKSILNSL